MKYILGSDSLAVFFKGNSYTVNRDSHIFPMVIEAVKANNEVKLQEALDMRNTIATKLSATGKVKVENGKVFHGQYEITGLVTTRVLEMLRMGLDIKPMIKFIENLMQNPSSRAVNELFGFLEACSLPITEDGHFLAYKRVKDNYKDVYSGTMDNSKGQVVEMPRNHVDEEKSRTCSAGLHFCSYSYLKHFFGERIMVVKINPADVVAIPIDYNNAKGRTCRYEVVDEIPVNEYNLPEVELPEGYTEDYSDFDEDFSDFDEELDDNFDVTQEILDGPMCKAKADMMREHFSKGQITLTELAEDYDISRRQAGRIIANEAWV